MPLANIYCPDPKIKGKINGHLKDIQAAIAKALSYSESKLSPDDIRIRGIHLDFNSDNIAQIEIDIFAYDFKERVEREDEIAKEIEAEIKKIVCYPDVKVFPIFCKIGHS
jgi:hypothetical protein